jgi:hypothetical protein
MTDPGRLLVADLREDVRRLTDAAFTVASSVLRAVHRQSPEFALRVVGGASDVATGVSAVLRAVRPTGAAPRAGATDVVGAVLRAVRPMTGAVPRVGTADVVTAVLWALRPPPAPPRPPAPGPRAADATWRVATRGGRPGPVRTAPPDQDPWHAATTAPLIDPPDGPPPDAGPA